MHSLFTAPDPSLWLRLKWLTVNQLISYHTLLTVFKIRKSGEPEYLARYLQDDNRAGRNIVPNTQLTLAKKSFVWRGSQQWNLLSSELRNSTKIGHFKRGARVGWSEIFLTSLTNNHYFEMNYSLG